MKKIVLYTSVFVGFLNCLNAQSRMDKLIKDKKEKLKEKVTNPDISNGGQSLPQNNGNPVNEIKKADQSAFKGTSYSLTRFAGSGFFGGNNSSGYKDGDGLSALFYYPTSITMDENENIYVADRKNYCIRKITKDGMVSTFAGTNEQDSKGGIGKDARFFDPTYIWYDGKSNFYVTEIENNAIRRINKEGKVTSVIYGKGKMSGGYKDGAVGIAQFDRPVAVVADSKGDVFVLDQGNNCIRKISGIEVSTFAGSNRSGYKDATGSAAQFDSPMAMVIDANDNLYVLETGKQWIRKITPAGEVTTFADFANINAGYGMDKVYDINAFQAMSIDAKGNLYITDGGNRAIHMVTSNGKDISYILTGQNCVGYDDEKYKKDAYATETVDGQDCKGVIVSRDLTGLSVSLSGVIYLVDFGGSCIHKISKK